MFHLCPEPEGWLGNDARESTRKRRRSGVADRQTAEAVIDSRGSREGRGAYAAGVSGGDAGMDPSYATKRPATLVARTSFR